MKLKSCVKLRGIRPEMLMGHFVVWGCYEEVCVECIVTSCNDSTHGKGSLHFNGTALDYRSRNVPRGTIGDLVQNIKSSIGKEFDVVLEGLDTPNEHIHVEYQPK